MLRKKIKEELKNALKKREKEVVSTLRLLVSEIINREKDKRYHLSQKEGLSAEELEKRSELTDEEVVEVVASEVKKRKEAMEEFKKAGRSDLFESYQREVEVLKRYLPPQLTDEELKEKVERAVEEMGASSMKDMGRVMGRVMSEVKGKAGGERVSAFVKKTLSHD